MSSSIAKRLDELRLRPEPLLTVAQGTQSATIQGNDRIVARLSRSWENRVGLNATGKRRRFSACNKRMLATTLQDSHVQLQYLTLRGPQPNDAIDDFWRWYGMDMDDEDQEACSHIAKILKKDYSVKTVSGMGALLFSNMQDVLKLASRPKWLLPIEVCARLKFRHSPSEPLSACTQGPTATTSSVASESRSMLSTSSSASQGVAMKPRGTHGGTRKPKFGDLKPLTKLEINNINLDAERLNACIWDTKWNKEKHLEYKDSTRFHRDIFAQCKELGPRYVQGSDDLFRHLAGEAYRVAPMGPYGPNSFFTSIHGTFGRERPFAEFSEEQLQAAKESSEESRYLTARPQHCTPARAHLTPERCHVGPCACAAPSPLISTRSRTATTTRCRSARHGHVTGQARSRPAASGGPSPRSSALIHRRLPHTVSPKPPSQPSSKSPTMSTTATRSSSAKLCMCAASQE
jgi:hypothetical protein